MKKALFLILFVSFQFYVRADSIPVNLSANGTIGACLENQFVAIFQTDSLHRLSIEPLLNSNDTTVNSCLDSIYHPQLLFSLDSSSVPVSDQVLDTNTGRWTVTINSTGICTLYYHIYIDCSVIPTSNTTSTLSLSQIWTDSLSHIYSFGGNVDTSASLVVFKPHLVSIGTSSFFANYLDTIQMTFMYKNTNSGTANILVRFFHDSSHYCASLPPIALNFRVGINGFPIAYTSGTEIPITLFSNDTLIFEELAIDSLCIYCDTICTNNTCTRNVNFNWRCNVPPAIDNIFCSDCQNNYIKSYSVINSELHQVKVELAPASLTNPTNDESCLNDTAFLHWEYIITNPGVSAIDSLKIDLKYLNIESVTNLTLIPYSTFSIISNCSNCIISTDTMIRDDSVLCTNFVPYPLKKALSSIKYFLPGDTVWLSFSTFRCGEENDLELLNKPKFFNQWRVNVEGITVCGDQASLVVPGGYLYNINPTTASTTFNLDLKLQFIPSITDLSVPTGSIFGDSARFEIESKNIVARQVDYQLFGYTGVPKLSGWLRATIHCEKGLVVKDRESEVFFQYFDVDSGKNIIITPEFYHASIPVFTCDTGNYFFYFNLEDTLMLRAINGGKFIFNLQACCNSNPAATDFEVKFHLIPNPDNCLNLSYTDTSHLQPPNCTGISCHAWIPLSSSGSRIFTHCPGCLAPGIIVKDYKMKRISYGLQDSNNDGLADDSLVQIMNPSPWFTAHENDLIRHFSSYGDQLEDKLTSFFQEGDTTSDGYSYLQLKDIGLTLPYLQLSRIMPAGLDTMKAFPLEFTFFIDSIMTPANCIDCEGFSLDTSSTRTLYKLNVSGANLSQYLDIFQSENRMLFTFDGSIDSFNQLIGNLGSNTPYLDSVYPFKGFYEGQRFRLKVRYANCGNFIGGNNDSPSLSNSMIKSEITNKMWLCGKKQDHDIPQMVNTVSELRDSLNITINPNDTSFQLMDTSHTNNRLFFCETFGGIHYFFSQEARNYSVLDTAIGCDKFLTVVSHTVSANFPDVINMYPFEYRPPMLWPKSYEIEVPPGYYISGSKMRHEFKFMNDPYAKFTNWVAFDVIDSIGNFTIYDSTLSPPVCISDTLYPIALLDTNMYVKSNLTRRILQFTLSPLGCDSNSNFLVSKDSMAIIKFGNNSISCVDTAYCSINEISREATATNQIFTILPNLKLQTDPTTINVTGNVVCTQIFIKNLSTKIKDDINSSTASYVYLAIPDSASMPFLHNWVYYTPDTIYPIGQIIPIDSLFAINQVDTGLLCASFRNCDSTLSDTSYFTFHAGWNCNGFPNSPFDEDSVCNDTSQTITLIKSNANLSNSGKSPNQYSTYSLCDTIIVDADFVSTGSGYLYPTFIKLDSIPQGMGVLALYLVNSETNTESDVLTYNSTTGNYPIDAGVMDSLGFSNGAFFEGQEIKVKALLIPSCLYTSDSLPKIVFSALDYCATVYESSATYQGSILIEGSNCFDCFYLDKIASQFSIQAGDTMSFYIIIRANNADSGFVYIDEILPANFNLIGSIPPYIITPAQGYDTVVVTGFFNIPSACVDNYNVVKILFSDYDSLNTYSGIDSLIDSTCVNVGVACIDSNTVLFLAGDSSGNYAGVYTDTSIYVEGSFVINSDLTLVNCKVFTAAGAHIIATRDALLDLDSTVITSCDTMWQGITLTQDSKLKARNHSSIQDAVIGAEMLDASQVLLEQSEIINSVRGVKVVGPIGSTFPGYLIISEAIFGMFSSSFKPNYTGQPAHGVLPYAGIDMNDAVMYLGDAGIPSYFYRMNKGIVGLRTLMKIHNCKFNGITFDKFYHTDSDGSAIVIEGDINLTPAYLHLLPANYPDTTILNCHRGVYNNYSDLILQYCIMDNVRTGVECSGNKYRQYALVTDNTINATLYGALFYNNAGSDYNIIAGNFIKVDGLSSGVGIAVRESKNSVSGNYEVAWNHEIRVVDGTAGIELLNVASPQVRCNVIKLDEGDEQAISSTGISVLGCSSANITQNSVTGYTRSNTSRMGLSCQVSTSCQIGCNSVDSTGYGFHFGSSNLFTNFRGNKMKSHLEGLHLNTTAVIDTQTHAGNQWLGNYSSWYGAVNMNAASFFDVYKSLFVVDPSLPSIFIPTYPDTSIVAPYVDNTGWFVFFPDNGSSYACPDSTTCYQSEYVGDEGSPSLLAMIALDSMLSVEYIEETQSIAQLMLYEKLMRDTGLTGSDIIFQNFIYNEPILHNLYEARLSLQEYGEVEDSMAAVLLSMDSTIKSFGDSIRYYLNLQLESEMNYDTVITGFRTSLNLSRNIYASVIQQMRYENNEVLAEAGFYNSLVDNLDELPLINEEVINEVEIAFEEGGIESIVPYREQIFGIASQCPFQGGQGVFRARYFFSLFNDSIEYDDGAVCLAQGILKTSHPVKNISPRLIIKPNPASFSVEIKISDFEDGQYSIAITDIRGRELMVKNNLSGDSNIRVQTNEFVPGVYYVIARKNKSHLCREKLIIIR